MAGRIAHAPHRKPFPQARLEFGVDRAAAANRRKHLGEGFVILDEEIASGGARENLDAGRTRQALQMAEIARVLARRPDEEREIAMHAPRARGDFRGQCFRARGRRAGVGHLEHGRDAAEHGRTAARLQVLLVLHAGLAEMDLGIDHAGQDVKAARIDDFAAPAAGDVADLANSAVADADIGEPSPA
ncbi:MAG: hypothetical protein A49_14960 [Methyloceanibacter sp.]|nr:MAG: hypothetical protein A49_14960 [Methyloceanibacter sp.]